MARDRHTPAPDSARSYRCVLMIVSTTASTLRFGTPVTVAPFALLLAFSIVALVSENRTVHAVVACVAALTVALGIGLPVTRAA